MAVLINVSQGVLPTKLFTLVEGAGLFPCEQEIEVMQVATKSSISNFANRIKSIYPKLRSCHSNAEQLHITIIILYKMRVSHGGRKSLKV